MANGIDAGQLYVDWLYSYLRQLYMSGDETYGDPSKAGAVGEEREWWRPDPDPSSAFLLLNEAADLIDAGVWGTTREASLPQVDQFYSFMGGYQRVHPEPDETPFWEGGSTIIPGELIRMPDGTYKDYTGVTVDPSAAIYMLSDYYPSESVASMTPYQIEQMNLGYKQIEADLYGAGLASQSQMANIEMLREKYYNEYRVAQQEANVGALGWLSGLAAQPKNYLERWFAEHLPQGAEMPPGLATDYAGFLQMLQGGAGQMPQWQQPMMAQQMQQRDPRIEEMMKLLLEQKTIQEQQQFAQAMEGFLGAQGYGAQASAATAQLMNEINAGYRTPAGTQAYAQWLASPTGVLAYQQTASPYAQTGQWPAATNVGGEVTRGTGIDYGYTPGSWSAPAPAAAPAATSGTWSAPGGGSGTWGQGFGW